MIQKLHNAPVNRSHKDRLFRLVFRDKEDILQLYNAVNGTDYQNADDLEINTMEGVIYLGMKNDLSFLIGDTLNLYEHQSSYSLNLPLRGFLYLADIYRGYIKVHGLDLYKNSREPLPLPKYLVFYNGDTDEPDCTTLKLSDAFIQPDKKEVACLECTATLLNINLGHNKQLMEKCQQLHEYAQFVARIKIHLEEGLTVKEAVDKGVDECVEQGILAEILKKNRAEVVEVVLTEYEEKRHLENVREEGRIEGKSAGIKEGIAQGITKGISKGIAKGFTKGKSEAILELLREYGTVPNEIEETILCQTDLGLLTIWLKIAAKAESIEEFVTNIS